MDVHEHHVITYHEHIRLGWSWHCSCGHFQIALLHRQSRLEAEQEAAKHVAFWMQGD